jgi:hypothetical protein
MHQASNAMRKAVRSEIGRYKNTEDVVRTRSTSQQEATVRTDRTATKSYRKVRTQNLAVD